MVDDQHSDKKPEGEKRPSVACRCSSNCLGRAALLSAPVDDDATIEPTHGRRACLIINVSSRVTRSSTYPHRAGRRPRAKGKGEGPPHCEPGDLSPGVHPPLAASADKMRRLDAAPSNRHRELLDYCRGSALGSAPHGTAEGDVQ